MLISTMFTGDLPAPSGNEQLPSGAGLATARYRRWVERSRHAVAAQEAAQLPVPSGRSRRRAWIRVPSPASGTLSRLP